MGETERTSRGWYKPGASGNPTGRPKGNPAVKELLKANSIEAANVLVGLLHSENDKIAFQAAQEILNRTEGKPMQSVNMEVNGEMNVRSHVRALVMEHLNGKHGNQDAD